MDGKNGLVTGATQGPGAAIARRLAAAFRNRFDGQDGNAIGVLGQINGNLLPRHANVVIAVIG